MNGVDYTKKLHQDREYYQNTLEKDREQSDKKIQDAEERHAKIQKQTREKYYQDKADLEKNHAMALDDKYDSTKTALEEKNKKYSQKLNSERENFIKSQAAKSKEYDQKLSDLNDSYQKAVKSERKAHEDIMSNVEKRTNHQVKSLRSSNDEKLSDLQKKSNEAREQMTQTQADERRLLNKTHQDKMENTIKEEFAKKQQIKSDLQNASNKMKQSLEEDNQRIKDQTKDQITGIRKESETRNQSVAKTYEEKNQKLQENIAKEMKSSNLKQQEEIAALAKNHRREIYEKERDHKRRGFGTEEGGASQRQQGLATQEGQDHKFKLLSQRVKDIKNDYSTKYDSDQLKMADTLQQEKEIYSANLEKKERVLGEEKIAVMADEREKTYKQIQEREASQIAQKNGYESQLVLEKSNARDAIQRMNTNFNKNMNQINEKNAKYVEDLKAQAGKDKGDFMRKVEAQRSQEIQELRQNFDKHLSDTSLSYEEKIAYLTSENKRVKEMMEQRLALISNEAERQIQLQQQVYEEKRQADINAERSSQQQKENDLRAQLTQMNTLNQKKINTIQNNSESQLKELTNSYESKIKLMSVAQQKSLFEKDQAFAEEMKRMKSALENDKARLVAQYQNQIETMRSSQEEKLKQLTEYKNLG